MKKLLIGTSALVAAAAFSSSAFADSALKLTLGGDYNWVVGYASSTYTEGGTQKFNGVDNKDQGHLNIDAKGTLDNGLTVAVHGSLYFSGRFGGRNYDENYATIGSDAIGNFVYAQAQGPIRDFHHAAPSFSNQVWLEDGVIATWVADTTGGAIDNGTYGEEDGRQNAFAYLTPSFGGFKAHVEYVPSTTRSGETGTSNNLILRKSDTDALGAGFAYDGKFGDTKFGVDFGWDGALTPKNVGLDSKNEYTLGASISNSGFTLGSGWREQVVTFGGSTPTFTDITWDVGVAYETGPIHVAASYKDVSEKEGSFKQNGSVISVTGAYDLGAGVQWTGEIASVYTKGYYTGASWAQADATSTLTPQTNHGLIVATGLELSF